jgi:hypothetical protein
MSTPKRALILVEGQTEERFVHDVLAPEFAPRGLYFQPTLLKTKRVKDGPDFRGDVSTYAKIRDDLLRLLRSAGGVLVTTLIDYYGLPGDFPGKDKLPPQGTPAQRACLIEKAWADAAGHPQHFIPFLALHEIEAWLFASWNQLPDALHASEKQKSQFTAICSGFPSPEDINDHPDTAPSKRIQTIFTGYKKVLHGPPALGRIGLPAIRKACPHLNQWLEQLEAWASTII